MAAFGPIRKWRSVPTTLPRLHRQPSSTRWVSQIKIVIDPLKRRPTVFRPGNEIGVAAIVIENFSHAQVATGHCRYMNGVPVEDDRKTTVCCCLRGGNASSIFTLVHPEMHLHGIRIKELESNDERSCTSKTKKLSRHKTKQGRAQAPDETDNVDYDQSNSPIREIGVLMDIRQLKKRPVDQEKTHRVNDYAP